MDLTPYLNLIRPSEFGDTRCFGESPDPLEIVNDYPAAELYLSDLPEFPLKRLGRVDRVWENANTARLTASTQFISDLGEALSSPFPARPLKSATMGQTERSRFVTPPTALQTLPIPTRYQQGGELLIRSLGLQWSSAVTGQLVGLYRKDETVPIETISLNVPAQSKRQTALAKSWRLPMDGTEYELRTLLPMGVQVADNQISCCSNTPNLTSLIPRCYTGKASGWMVSLSGACSYDPLIAQLLDVDATRRVIAYALGYLVGYTLCVRIKSGEIDRWSVLSETDVDNAGAVCRSEYSGRLSWLKTQISKMPISTDNTCFQKLNPVGWSRSGVIT